jgi:putative protease
MLQGGHCLRSRRHVHRREEGRLGPPAGHRLQPRILDGYYQGQTLGEWNSNYGSNATEKKVYVGHGVKYFSRLGVAEFTVDAAEFSVGDKLLITGPTTGVIYLDATEIRYDLQPVDTAHQGEHVSIPVPDKIRPSDKLFKLVKTSPDND